MWTGCNDLGYIFTAHYIDQNWILHKNLIAFRSLDYPYNANNIYINLLLVFLKNMEYMIEFLALLLIMQLQIPLQLIYLRLTYGLSMEALFFMGIVYVILVTYMYKMV